MSARPIRWTILARSLKGSERLANGAGLDSINMEVLAQALGSGKVAVLKLDGFCYTSDKYVSEYIYLTFKEPSRNHGELDLVASTKWGEVISCTALSLCQGQCLEDRVETLVHRAINSLFLDYANCGLEALA